MDWSVIYNAKNKKKCKGGFSEQDLTGIGIPLSERHGFTAVEWGGEMLGE